MNEFEYNKFFIDVLNIFSDPIDCFIQAPSLEDNVIEEMFQDSEFKHYKLLKIDNNNKEKIVLQEIETLFSIYIQKIEIKRDNILMFEGFDGVEFGIFSKTLILPDWFLSKYVPETCEISTKW